MKIPWIRLVLAMAAGLATALWIWVQPNAPLRKFDFRSDGGRRLFQISGDSQAIVLCEASRIRRWGFAQNEMTVIESDDIDPLAIAISNDAKLLVTSSTQGSYLWDLDAKKLAKKLPVTDLGHVHRLYFTRSGAWVASDEKETINLETGVSTFVFQKAHGDFVPINPPQFMGVLSGGHVRIVDQADDRLVGEFDIKKDHSIWGARMSPDGRFLTCFVGMGWGPRAIFVADFRTGAAKWIRHGAGAYVVDISPDGKTLAFIDEAAPEPTWIQRLLNVPRGPKGLYCHLLDIETDLITRLLAGDDMAYSPDGRLLAVISFQAEELAIWRMAPPWGEVLCGGVAAACCTLLVLLLGRVVCARTASVLRNFAA